MPAHRTQTLVTGPQTAVATCSCGWTGQDRRDKGTASIDANKHLIEARRANAAGDPNQLEIENTRKAAK